VPPWLHPAPEGVTIDLFVQPRASKNRIIGVQGDELKVCLTSPPVDGAANALCREYFAKILRVSKGSVTLVAGEKSRHKRLRIDGVNETDARNTIEINLNDGRMT